MSAKGYSLILLARSKEKLDTLVTELGTSVKVSTVTIDFGNPTAANWEEVRKAFEGKQIRVLINNVGVGKRDWRVEGVTIR